MFSEWITRSYILQPHVMMPAPLPAVEDDIRVRDEHVRCDQNGELAAAVVASDSNIELIWARKDCLDLLLDLLAEVIGPREIAFLAINHTRYAIDMENLGFEPRNRYFRLLYKGQRDMVVRAPQGFQTKDYTHQQDDKMAVELIQTCYAQQGIAISLEILTKLRSKRFFDPALWFWIVEDDSEKPCALAISHCDTEIGEGWLDWIQVLPELRRRGLGRMLVEESIYRLRNAKMITVSGDLDNPDKPLRLYKKCGFNECQEWLIMQRHVTGR